METITARPPLHLWVVGILSLLWSGFGCYDYTMTRTQGAAYLGTMMPGIDGNAFMAYIDRFPVWVSAGWAIGVWGALLGSLLLLLRSRLAVPVFMLSLIGAIAGVGYQLAVPAEIPGLDSGANAVMPYVVLAIAAFLLFYARAMKARGVLN